MYRLVVTKALVRLVWTIVRGLMHGTKAKSVST